MLSYVILGAMFCRVIFSGPFCTGKTTLMEKLEKEYGTPKLIDDSTRPMRPNERQGFPYHFIAEEEFLNKLNNEEYFESVHFNGYYYGVPKAELAKNKWTLDVLSTSWKHYKDIPYVIGIYLESPGEEELIRRARKRGDSEEKIRQRLEALKDEDPSEFIYRIPPQEKIEDTFEIVKQIIEKEEALRQ